MDEPIPIISVSGLRGVLGESLTPLVAMRYACAFAANLPSGPIVVTRDGRPSGEMLSKAVASGLNAMGRPVIDAGIAATPTTGILVHSIAAAGGIQITASHNPAEYNGLKLFAAQGRVVNAEAGIRVRERFLNSPILWSRYDNIATTESWAGDSAEEHLRRIQNIVNVDRIRERRFKVLLDSNHGAGSILGRRLLSEFNCEYDVLGDAPDGQFAHPPEPTSGNLLGVARMTAERRVDVVFCQDPDADRLAIIDEGGRYLGEEYTLAICVDHVLRMTKGPIVTNCSTSRISQRLAQKHQVPFFHTAVGEANVVDKMLAKDAIFGGEGNGGVIDPRVVLVRDSFAAMALILDAMAARDTTVSRLADELPRYVMRKAKLEVTSSAVDVGVQAMRKLFSDAEFSMPDGVRFDWDQRWLLIRASNTEPIVRVVVEAEDERTADELCTQACDILQSKN